MLTPAQHLRHSYLPLRFQFMRALRQQRRRNFGFAYPAIAAPPWPAGRDAGSQNCPPPNVETMEVERVRRAIRNAERGAPPSNSCAKNGNSFSSVSAARIHGMKRIVACDNADVEGVALVAGARPGEIDQRNRRHVRRRHARASTTGRTGGAPDRKAGRMRLLRVDDPSIQGHARPDLRSVDGKERRARPAIRPACRRTSRSCRPTWRWWANRTRMNTSIACGLSCSTPTRATTSREFRLRALAPARLRADDLDTRGAER